MFLKLSRIALTLLCQTSYISENDKNEVGINVLASEPKMALFADEEDLPFIDRLLRTQISI